MSDRLNYYFRQRVTEDELDLGFANAEDAERALMTDMHVTGVLAGAVVTVDVSGSAVLYD